MKDVYIQEQDCITERERGTMFKHVITLTKKKSFLSNVITVFGLKI